MNDLLNLTTFAPLDGILPHLVLDRHPDGRAVALQAPFSPLDRAAVWDAQTGALIWNPGVTMALHWLPNGEEIVLLRERSAVTRGYPPLADSPLGDGNWYVLERASWPGRTVVGACKVVLPEGWGNAVTVSPRGDLAAVRWFEQDAAGFVLVALREGGDRQLPDPGYRTAPDNLVQGPVFSPDGRFLVLSCGRGFWWAGDDEGEDPTVPASGGRYEIGHVAIYDVREKAAQEIVIEEDVPAGWLPEDPEDLEHNELLGEPRFIAAHEFTVTLPTGTERRFSTVS